MAEYVRYLVVTVFVVGLLNLVCVSCVYVQSVILQLQNGIVVLFVRLLVFGFAVMLDFLVVCTSEFGTP